MRNKFEGMTPPKERQEDEVNKFPAEKWIDISTGMEVDYFGRKEQLQIFAANESNMTYNTNNGVIAFVDGEGRMHVAPATSDRYRALEEAGYKHGSFWVPLSNGEMPTDPALRERWEKMLKEARQVE